MIYQKQISVAGNWVKASDLRNGMKAQIITETIPVPSRFQNRDGSVKNQDVCKVRFEGFNDAFNVALNRATISGLIDAYGNDSNNWTKHQLTVETEKVRVAAKSVIALYLIPDGYERADDENGYAIIVKKNHQGPNTIVAPRDTTLTTGYTRKTQDDVNAELAGQNPEDEDLPF